MKKFFMFMLITLISVSFLVSDVYIKTKSHTGAMNFMGKNTPAKDDVTEQWIGDNVYSLKSSKQIIIIDLNKNVIFLVNPSEKTYIETTLPLDLKKFLPDQVASMMGMMKLSIKVTPTSETKVIKGWNCKGYDMEMNVMMMKMNSKLWVTQDVPFDWKSFRDKMGIETFRAAFASMSLGDDAINEFKKINGFQVASNMTMSIMGQNIEVTSEVLEVVKKSAPAGTYTVPAGFKKVEKLSMSSLKR